MRYRLALVLLCVGVLPGCGQRGPLVLPDRRTRTPVSAQPPTAAPAGPAGTAAPVLPVPPADPAPAPPPAAHP